MFSLFLIALALLNNAYCALGAVKFVRPPSAGSHQLPARSGLETIESGLVNWSGLNNPQNATIVPVILSDDSLCVVTYCFHLDPVVIMIVPPGPITL